jgi:hypothetical protein
MGRIENLIELVVYYLEIVWYMGLSSPLGGLLLVLLGFGLFQIFSKSFLGNKKLHGLNLLSENSNYQERRFKKIQNSLKVTK